MVGATFKGICYMHGMCFAMLTPMLYISVCRKICGVIRGKGIAHVQMVSSMALHEVYHTYSARGKPCETTHKRHYQFSHFHGAYREDVRRCPLRPCGDPSGGIVCKWSQAIVF